MNKTTQQKFEEFDAANPEIYEYLCEQAQKVRDSGLKRYGIRALYERARWHFQVENREADYKLNDHYMSRYARKMLEEFPELEGFFELRPLRVA